MTALAIKTHSLAKTFTSTHSSIRAVDGLSLSVPEGSMYGLIGRNSSGKTTTMGLARPTSGSAEVLGLNPRFQISIKLGIR